MRSTPVIAAALATALMALGACSDGDGTSSAEASDTPSTSASSSESTGSPGSTESSGSPTATKTPPPAGTTVDITIKDGKVSPNGDRVKARIGKPITLNIDADTAGELHVHSTPEQELEFDKGTSTKRLTIEQPGIVDVEDHGLEQIIVQLEVR
jgi:hypothetical protein